MNNRGQKNIRTLLNRIIMLENLTKLKTRRFVGRTFHFTRKLEN